MQRREFLKGLAVLGMTSSVGSDFMAAQSSQGDMPYRTLGKTGEKISAIGMGGFHIGQPKIEEAQSIRLIRSAIDRGINFMDNSWDYNEGQSEIRMGKALQNGYRQKVFLMSGGRPRIPLRHRADAAERDGRTFPQL